MTVFAVTARQPRRSRGRGVANIPRAPTRGRVIPFRLSGRVLTRGPTLARKLSSFGSRASLIKAAKLLSRGSLPVLAATTAASLYFRTRTEPNGFPGFDNINPGWRDPEAPNGYVPGDYVPNAFDYGPNAPPPVRALLDIDDVQFPDIRYWGDFGANPYPNPVPGNNWPLSPRVTPKEDEDPKNKYGPAYRRLRNRARDYDPYPRWKPTDGIKIEIDPDPVPGTKVWRVWNNPPRKRSKDPKIRPANQFVWLVLKKIANAGGEIKEYADIFAEASGYQKGSKELPERLRNKGVETQAKLWWLFFGEGLNNLDWSQLAFLIIENEIEDFVYGALGQLSKAAARNLNLTVGPQTGLVM